MTIDSKHCGLNTSRLVIRSVTGGTKEETKNENPVKESAFHEQFLLKNLSKQTRNTFAAQEYILPYIFAA